jgi:hypothetical protein
LHMGPYNRKNIRICAPASSRWRLADLLRRVLTGGEVPGEDGVGSRTPTRGGVNRRFKTKTNNTREI